MAADDHLHSASAGKVLVVEDEMLVQMLVVDVVSDLGLQTLEASDAPSALAMLDAEGAVSLMITDVGLPGMDGRRLADAARALRPALKVLFVTGQGDNPALADLGADFAVIGKPFALEDLARKVSGMLELG